MATKRGSLEKQTPRRKAAGAAPTIMESGVPAALESPRSAPSAPTGIEPEVRRQMVAIEAYFLAERRGFAIGYEVEDWLAAEAVVEARLAQMGRAELTAKHIVQ